MHVQKVLLLVLISFPVSLASCPDLIPTVVSVSHCCPGQIHVSWGPLQPAQVLKYIVEYSAIPCGYVHIMTLRSHQCSTTLNGLDQDTEYLITVTAVYVNGQERAMSVKAHTANGIFLAQISECSCEFGSCFRYFRRWRPKVLHLLSSHPIPSFKNSQSVNSFLRIIILRCMRFPRPCCIIVSLWCSSTYPAWPLADHDAASGCSSIMASPSKRPERLLPDMGARKLHLLLFKVLQHLSLLALYNQLDNSHAPCTSRSCVCVSNLQLRLGRWDILHCEEDHRVFLKLYQHITASKEIKASVASCFSDYTLWLSPMSEINNQYESEAARAKNGLNGAF